MSLDNSAQQAPEQHTLSRQYGGFSSDSSALSSQSSNSEYASMMGRSMSTSQNTLSQQFGDLTIDNAPQPSGSPYAAHQLSAAMTDGRTQPVASPYAANQMSAAMTDGRTQPVASPYAANQLSAAMPEEHISSQVSKSRTADGQYVTTEQLTIDGPTAGGSGDQHTTIVASGEGNAPPVLNVREIAPGANPESGQSHSVFGHDFESANPSVRANSYEAGINGAAAANAASLSGRNAEANANQFGSGGLAAAGAENFGAGTAEAEANHYGYSGATEASASAAWGPAVAEANQYGGQHNSLAVDGQGLYGSSIHVSIAEQNA